MNNKLLVFLILTSVVLLSSSYADYYVEVFDDFNDGTINKDIWYVRLANGWDLVEESGYLKSVAFGDYGGAGVVSKQSFPEDIILEGYFKFPVTNGNYHKNIFSIYDQSKVEFNQYLAYATTNSFSMWYDSDSNEMELVLCENYGSCYYDIDSISLSDGQIVELEATINLQSSGSKSVSVDYYVDSGYVATLSLSEVLYGVDGNKFVVEVFGSGQFTPDVISDEINVSATFSGDEPLDINYSDYGNIPSVIDKGDSIKFWSLWKAGNEFESIKNGIFEYDNGSGSFVNDTTNFLSPNLYKIQYNYDNASFTEGWITNYTHYLSDGDDNSFLNLSWDSGVINHTRAIEEVYYSTYDIPEGIVPNKAKLYFKSNVLIDGADGTEIDYVDIPSVCFRNGQVRLRFAITYYSYDPCRFGSCPRTFAGIGVRCFDDDSCGVTTFPPYSLGRCLLDWTEYIASNDVYLDGGFNQYDRIDILFHEENIEWGYLNETYLNETRTIDGDVGQDIRYRFYGNNTDGTIVSTPLVTSTIQCPEDWSCSSWSTCQGAYWNGTDYTGLEFRTCTDLNAKGTEYCKPEENRTCDCIPNWQVGDWGECQPEGQIYRIVTDLNACNKPETMPINNQQCIFEKWSYLGLAGDWFKTGFDPIAVPVVAIVLGLAFATIVWVFFGSLGTGVSNKFRR